MDEKLAQSLAQRKLDIQHKQQMDKLSSLENSVVSTMRQLVKFIDGKVTKTEVVNQLKSVSTPDMDKVVDALNKLDSNTTKNKLDLSPLQKCLETIEEKLDKLPTEYPEMPEGVEEVTVKNQIDLKPLEKAIKALKLDPTIEYKAGDVKVDAPDLKPLQDSLLDVVKTLKAQEFPKTDLSNVEKKLDESNKHLKKLVEKPVGGGGGGGNGTPYMDANGHLANVVLTPDGKIPVEAAADIAVRIDDYTAPGTAYIGKAAIGSLVSEAKWQISKLDTSSGLIKTWADSDALFNNIWDDRDSLTYS